MSSPVNQELRELRMVKEHYEKVLSDDAMFKENGVVGDGVRLLSDEDISRINRKISALDEKIGELLLVTDF